MIPVCPIAAARDALTLLQTGRAGMALRIMEALPGAIEAALRRATGEAYLRGQAEAHRIIAATRKRRQAAARSPALRMANRLDMLRTALADPSRRQLLKTALGMDDRLLDRVAAGGATLSGVQWRKLREALA